MRRAKTSVHALLFSIAFFSSLSSSLAQPAGRLVIEMIEAGGNAAQYGYVSVGEAPGRTQGASCPRVSQGNLPIGLTRCEAFFGSDVPTEWQPFDILTATVPADSQTTIPSAVRPADATSCVWTFEGFTGACSGLGAFDQTRNVYQCQFVLPESGELTLGVRISGFDNQNRPCPPLDVPSFQPKPVGTPTPTPFPPATGSNIVQLLNTVADQILDGMRDQKIRRVVEKVISKELGPTFEQFEVAVLGSAAPATRTRSSGTPILRKKKKGKSCPKIVARGSATTSTTEASTLKVRFTKKGRQCLRGTSNKDVNFSFSATRPGEVAAASSTSRTLLVRGKSTS
ncbi:MAG: hypothetical protein KDD70_12735 [Bdellovibrionales bacterium]|nr:hypothetical protein [Bdellovibrionales bacterium]